MLRFGGLLIVFPPSSELNEFGLIVYCQLGQRGKILFAECALVLRLGDSSSVN